ncbi:hypothetical protein P5V15_007155 [Pogonomyrmex californicus]
MDNNEKNMNEMQDLNYENMNEMSSQQVRWKMNALTKRYKECIDSNNKTGRSAVEFQWFDQLDEIFGKNKKNNVKSAYTVSTKLSSFFATTSKNKEYNATATNEQSEDKGKKKKELHESHFEVKNTKRTVLEEICPSSNIAANKQVIEDVTATMQPETLKKLCPAHGTASNIAKSKIELGKQWHQYLWQDKTKREIKLKRNGTTT